MLEPVYTCTCMSLSPCSTSASHIYTTVIMFLGIVLMNWFGFCKLDFMDKGADCDFVCTIAMA